jgi:hypothetical protein
VGGLVLWGRVGIRGCAVLCRWAGMLGLWVGCLYGADTPAGTLACQTCKLRQLSHLPLSRDLSDMRDSRRLFFAESKFRLASNSCKMRLNANKDLAAYFFKQLSTFSQLPFHH